MVMTGQETRSYQQCLVARNGFSCALVMHHDVAKVKLRWTGHRQVGWEIANVLGGYILLSVC